MSAGDYRRLGELGRGGMATVYLAEHAATGERVALKVLHKHLADDPRQRARLRRELAAAERLDHPSTLVARELLEEGDEVALVLPYFPGRTLAEVIATEGPLPPDQVQRLALRLAEALEAAHAVGVLHRDISPANVMLDERGAAVLTDFGLAQLDEGRTGQSTGLLGTAGHTAPEVYAGDRGDPRSDVYALGTVLYQAATGQLPFAAPHPAGVLQRQLDGAATPVRDLVPQVPEGLATAIEACLQVDPDDRPGGAGHLRQLLEAGEGPTAMGFRDRTRALAHDRAMPPVRADGGVHLPVGEWAVGVRLRRKSEPTDGLARAVERGLGLDEGALAAPAVGRRRRLLLVEDVDEATAVMLAKAARVQGYQASARRAGTPTLLDRVLGQYWILFPGIWVTWPFAVANGLPDWTMVLAVMATIVLAAIIGPWVERRRAPEEWSRRPRAWDGYIRQRELAGPTPTTVVEEPDATHSSPAGRALAALAGLDTVNAALADTLPQTAHAELTARTAALRQAVEALQVRLAQLDAALDQTGGQEDAAWLAERQRRLETLQAAGEAVDPDELQAVAASAARVAEADALRDGLERQRTVVLCRLLEIGASADHARRTLMSAPEPQHSADQAASELKRLAIAAAKARAEVTPG